MKDEDETELLDVEITSLCITYKHVYLVGDMNARTADVQDYSS